MKYRIERNSPGGGKDWILWFWHRGEWARGSYHDTHREASMEARMKYPDGEYVDPEVVKAMPETIDE